jgi:hypothetical protein
LKTALLQYERGIIGGRSQSPSNRGLPPRGKNFASGWRMLDFLSVAATVIFFFISLAYVRGCEKL